MEIFVKIVFAIIAFIVIKGLFSKSSGGKKTNLQRMVVRPPPQFEFQNPVNNVKSGDIEYKKKRNLLTDREQAMFNRLHVALPEYRVLAQVSFGALLWTKNQFDRTYFNKKIADFVVCDKSFRVLAVVELDDATHKNKVEEDVKRDAMLQMAGYKTLRYPNVPDIDQVIEDFARLANEGVPGGVRSNHGESKRMFA